MTKPKPSSCSTPHCRRKRAKGRTKCLTCKCREYRERNPMRAAYNALRDNAKRRHKEFTLTFSEFKEFCVKTNYMAGKGRQKLSYTIDRAKNWLGYTKDNIQCMTKSDNSSKGTRSFTLHYDWQTKYATVVHNTRDRGGGDFDLPK